MQNGYLALVVFVLVFISNFSFDFCLDSEKGTDSLLNENFSKIERVLNNNKNDNNGIKSIEGSDINSKKQSCQLLINRILRNKDDPILLSLSALSEQMIDKKYKLMLNECIERISKDQVDYVYQITSSNDSFNTVKSDLRRLINIQKAHLDETNDSKTLSNEELLINEKEKKAKDRRDFIMIHLIIIGFFSLAIAVIVAFAALKHKFKKPKQDLIKKDN